MHARRMPSIAASLLATTGLVAGLPAVSAQVPTKQDHLDKKCRNSFKHDRQRLLRSMDADLATYDAHLQAEQVAVDQLIALKSDPNAADAIPALERGAAEFRAAHLPLLAKDRDKAYGEVTSFARAYRKCFDTKKGKKALRAAIGLVRSSFRELFGAHEKLLGANLAVQAADDASAQQYLTEAAVDYVIVEPTFDTGMKALRSLQ